MFALLELAKRIAEQRTAAGPSHQSPSTPSGMKPPYEKPTPNRRKGAGSQAGTSRIATNASRARRSSERASCRSMPRLWRSSEALPAPASAISKTFPKIQPEVTEHTIHRDWCPHAAKASSRWCPTPCRARTLGNRVLVLSAWLHYGLGNTLSQIVEVFNFHLQMKLTPGGLMQMWYRCRRSCTPGTSRFSSEALHSAVLHADETSWRVDGKTHWLWCFATRNLTYYMIDRRGASPALVKFFIQEFAGTLVTDFWGAYNAWSARGGRRAWCICCATSHHTEQYKSPGKHWPAFAKKLRRLLADAIRLWRTTAELVGGDVCFATRPPHDAIDGVDRHALGRSPGQAA